MKNILFTTATFTLLSITANAQSELTDFGVFEDFSTKTELTTEAATGRGIYWWAEPGIQTITRDTAKKQLLVDMSQGAYQYKPFGVGFGDDNGAAAGGVPNTIDISGNGKFSFDIENTGTESISVRVSCQDIQNRLVDCSPGATTFGEIWKYQTQIEVPAGKTVSFKAGTANGAGGGILNNCDFANGVWGDYGTNPHIIRTDCDLTKIKGINITVLNAAKNTTDGHNLALIRGLFGIANFRVGNTPANNVTLATNEMEVAHQMFSMYPNPATHSVIFKNNAPGKTDEPVQIINSYGQIVYSEICPSSVSEFVMDVSHLKTGIYYARVGEETQKIIIEK